jgi:hypothetical protein
MICSTCIVLYEKRDEVIMGWIALTYSSYMLYFFINLDIKETRKRNSLKKEKSLWDKELQVSCEKLVKTI